MSNSVNIILFYVSFFGLTLLVVFPFLSPNIRQFIARVIKVDSKKIATNYFPKQEVLSAEDIVAIATENARETAKQVSMSSVAEHFENADDITRKVAKEVAIEVCTDMMSNLSQSNNFSFINITKSDYYINFISKGMHSIHYSPQKIIANSSSFQSLNDFERVSAISRIELLNNSSLPFVTEMKSGE